MKKCKKILGLLLAVILLVGAVPAYAAETDTGYNGKSGSSKSFDYSYYDAVIHMTEMMGTEIYGETINYLSNEDFTWPSGKTILINVSGSAWDTDVLDYISVPDGKIVDVYYFNNVQLTYTFWAHYDTTNGVTVSNNTAAVSTSDGLNGDTCAVSDFNYDAYDVLAGVERVIKSTWTWPSSGNVMISVSGKYSFSDMDGVTIPAGLVVDVYGRDGGSNFVLLAHYDTTNGKSITVNTSDTSSGNNSNTGTGTNTGNTSIDMPSKPTSYTKSFSDVQPGAWYYDAVMTMAENGILAGYDNGKFGPDDILTFQQLYTILDRVCGMGDNYDKWGQFADAQDYVTRGAAAYTLASRSLKWNGSSARGYLAVTNARYEQHRLSHTLISSIDTFPDADDIKAWSLEYAPIWLKNNPEVLDTAEHQAVLLQNAIVRAYNYDFFSGVDSAGTFSPRTYLTRAQLCQALYNVGLYTPVH